MITTLQCILMMIMIMIIIGVGHLPIVEEGRLDAIVEDEAHLILWIMMVMTATMATLGSLTTAMAMAEVNIQAKAMWQPTLNFRSLHQIFQRIHFLSQ